MPKLGVADHFRFLITSIQSFVRMLCAILRSQQLDWGEFNAIFESKSIEASKIRIQKSVNCSWSFTKSIRIHMHADVKIPLDCLCTVFISNVKFKNVAAKVMVSSLLSLFISLSLSAINADNHSQWTVFQMMRANSSVYKKGGGE